MQDYSMLLMMVLIFAIMYFFMILPQQKKQKKIREFQNSLQEGTKVITAGGMYGTVKRVNLENNTVEVPLIAVMCLPMQLHSNRSKYRKDGAYATDRL